MKRILPVIVISQFFCTSLWFAGNAVVGDIVQQFHLGPGYLALLASVVQLGFISGTLVFGILSIADRFPPSRVFFASALVAALLNGATALNGINPTGLVLFRFLTGFFIAGIYPVGMKIASDHYQQGLGRSLGFLVGALVLGTAFPHLLRFAMVALPWRYVIVATSLLSLAGGLAILLFVPDGPHRRPGVKGSFTAFVSSFRNRAFRVVAFGYFGHMWELYTFWVYVPVMLAAYRIRYPGTGFNVPLMSFAIISVGSVACVLGGIISRRIGEKRTATIALTISCICCCISPLLLFNGSTTLFFVFLFVWSTTVIADSPLFSTLVARNAPAEARGTSLTIINCIGFSITIVSIQSLNMLKTPENSGYIYMLLAIGPLLGLVGLYRRKRKMR